MKWRRATTNWTKLWEDLILLGSRSSKYDKHLKRELWRRWQVGNHRKEKYREGLEEVWTWWCWRGWTSNRGGCVDNLLEGREAFRKIRIKIRWFYSNKSCRQQWLSSGAKSAVTFAFSKNYGNLSRLLWRLFTIWTVSKPLYTGPKNIMLWNHLRSGRLWTAAEGKRRP